jgi:hypothetical protein
VTTPALRITPSRSQSGYDNLCPNARGGDTPAMLTARRRFLEAGHYRRLQQAVAAIASRHLRSQAPNLDQPILVDWGRPDDAPPRLASH